MNGLKKGVPSQWKINLSLFFGGEGEVGGGGMVGVGGRVVSHYASTLGYLEKTFSVWEGQMEY